MKNKQTAVDLLVASLPLRIQNMYASEIENAKAIEKEQEFETKAYFFGRGLLAEMEGRIKELKSICKYD